MPSYILKRETDGAGFYGPLSAIGEEYHAVPRIGVQLSVGVLCFGGKEKPHTTDKIVEILYKTQGYVRFRTETHIYEWWEK